MTAMNPEDLLRHGVVEHFEPRASTGNGREDRVHHIDDNQHDQHADHADGAQEQTNGKDHSPRKPKPRLLSSAAFVASFTPPDWIWDGVLQRGFLYSLTARTGTGKTAIALLVAAQLTRGKSIGGRDTQQGSVVVLSGENSDDVRMRWLVMAERLGFDVDTIKVNFIEGVFSFTNFSDEAIQQIDRLPDCSLVIVDTSAAFFEGQDENGNVDVGNHARMLRRFTQCSTRPAVMVLCHPTKGAGDDNLLPRGGGAFLAEVDGNLSLKAITDTTVELHWQGKLRGPGFEPVSFDLIKTTSDRLVDGRGRKMMTVVASDLSHDEAEARQQAAVSKQDQLLKAMAELDDPSFSAIAKHLGWLTVRGEPQKSVIGYAMKTLVKAGLVEQARDGAYRLTRQGRREVERLSESAVHTFVRDSFDRTNWTDV